MSSHVSEQLDEPSLPVSGIHECTCILVGKEEIKREKESREEREREGGEGIHDYYRLIFLYTLA